MWPKITRNYSPNFSLPKRSKKNIKFIIIHYTGMKKESDAINKLCNYKSNVSAHYFIRKNGDIINLVPDLFIAWHAGISAWKKLKSLNKYSIGIEIQNSGHDHLFENFSSKQIITLKKLLKSLINKYNVKTQNILGHSDISPERKKDPGEKFPWKELYNSKLAYGHNIDEKKIKKYRLIKLKGVDEGKFLNNLSRIGYDLFKSKKSKLKKRLIFKAFQRRFRPNLVNGLSDQECLLISKNLLNN